MAFQEVVDGLDYRLCRYGSSRHTFRGPAQQIDDIAIAVLGGSETFGRFIDRPYPMLLEQELERPVVNLGCMHAGPEAFFRDPVVDEVCNRAQVVVIQIMGAQNTSNAFYDVHPRRNDRFLSASDRLRCLFAGVDLADVHFTGHLLRQLRRANTAAFEDMIGAVRQAWVTRMKSLIGRIDLPVVLFWLADKAPAAPGAGPTDLPAAATAAPGLINRPMIEQIRPLAVQVIECVCPAADDSTFVGNPFTAPGGRLFGPGLFGEHTHAQAANALAAALRPVLQARSGKGPAQPRATGLSE
ncbi:MAG: DUF6473 family protein [Pseudomonadota bacterium]